jgi:protein TonB
MPTVGVVGGVPGGVPGGAPSGLIGGIIGGVGSAPPPPPPPPVKEAPKPATPSRIRVGGNVQQASLLRQQKPVYPPLAKQARIQGTVRFEAVIAKDGTIQNLRVVSGHPLLVQAATDAVKQWVYKPTLLNNEPVEVVTTIDVNFTLAG